MIDGTVDDHRRCEFCGKVLVRRGNEYPSQFRRRRFCGKSCAGSVTGPHPARSLAERFWEKVDRQDPDECWPWLGYVQANGYGKMMDSGRCLLAHRVAYELTFGEIPAELVIDHVRARGCLRRDCVNPAHLEPVTMSENILRGDGPSLARAKSEARTHCKHGHALTPANTYAYQGERRCRTCLQEADQRHRDRRRTLTTTQPEKEAARVEA